MSSLSYGLGLRSRELLSFDFSYRCGETSSFQADRTVTIMGPIIRYRLEDVYSQSGVRRNQVDLLQSESDASGG